MQNNNNNNNKKKIKIPQGKNYYELKNVCELRTDNIERQEEDIQKKKKKKKFFPFFFFFFFPSFIKLKSSQTPLFNVV